MSQEVPQCNYGLRINEFIESSAILILSLKLVTTKCVQWGTTLEDLYLAIAKCFAMQA